MLALQASEKGVTMTRRVARGVTEVIADRRAVQQILINLMGNAIKFTETGGVVTTDVDRIGDDLRLTVSDTGIGMCAAQLARIGEPFSQGQNSLSRRYEGTGLGLSLVKGLVELHGGAFAIDSREGEGTTVTIRLPIDGSGIGAVNAAAEAAQTVEFPPRLRAAPVRTETSRDRTHDAQARIA
jgi:cell cycle sensor histidine kinase DivJ